MSEQEKPEAGQVWRHRKRGTKYEVLFCAALQIKDSAWDEKECVIYQGADGRKWARPLAEFMDGRFERVPPYALVLFVKGAKGQSSRQFPLCAMDIEAAFAEAEAICHAEIDAASFYGFCDSLGDRRYAVRRHFKDMNERPDWVGDVAVSLK